MADMKQLSEAAAMALGKHAMIQTRSSTENSNGEPHWKKSRELPPLPESARMERMLHTRSVTELTRQRDIWLLAQKNLPPLEVDARRQVKHELERLSAELVLAEEREQIQSGRPEGCWCLGLGGRPSGWIWSKTDPSRDPVQNFMEFCSCPDGMAARAAVEEINRDNYDAAVPGRRAALLAQIDADCPSDLAAFTLDSYRGEGGQQAVLRKIREAADGPPRSILLYGAASRGKTGLLLALMRHWISRELIPGRFWLVTKLMADIARQAASDIGIEGDTLLIAQNRRLVMIDDLGKQKKTAFKDEKLFEILGERHNRRLPTLLTSNLTPSELRHEDYLGPWGMDRITELCGAEWVMELKGSNRRVKQEAA